MPRPARSDTEVSVSQARACDNPQSHFLPVDLSMGAGGSLAVGLERSVV